MTPDITIVLFDGFDEIDVFGPSEILAAAGYDVRLATSSAEGVTSMRGVGVTTPHRLVPSRGVLVPGGGWLEGRYATTNRGCLNDLEPFVGTALDERVVDDGDRVTGGALFAGAPPRDPAIADGHRT